MARNGRGVFLSDGSNFEGEYLHISAFLAAFRCRRRLKRFGLLELEGDINTKILANQSIRVKVVPWFQISLS
jgi:hypothetical protein